MGTERESRTDKELWQSLAVERVIAPSPVSDLDFAAWLDGRLSEAAAVQIERAVAADPELRRVALELSDILSKPLPAAPVRLAVRAQALVGFDVERPARRGGGWLGRLFSPGPRYGVQRAAMAAVSIMLAIVGFMVGGGLGDSFAYQRYESGVSLTASSTSSTTSNDLDLFSDGI